MKPEGNQVRGSCCLLQLKEQRRALGYDDTFINIRGLQSEKVVGKNPNMHLPRELSEASLYRGNLGIWEGENS